MNALEKRAFALLEPWLCASSGAGEAIIKEPAASQRLLIDKAIVKLLLSVDTAAYFYNEESTWPAKRLVLRRYTQIYTALKNLEPEIAVDSASDIFTADEVRGLSYYACTASGTQPFAGSLQSWCYHIIINGTHPITREDITGFCPITVGPRTRSTYAQASDVAYETDLLAKDYQATLNYKGLPECFLTIQPIFVSTLRVVLLSPLKNLTPPGYAAIRDFEKTFDIPEDRQYSRLILLECLHEASDIESDMERSDNEIDINAYVAATAVPIVFLNASGEMDLSF
jgi:hypothetical protein